MPYILSPIISETCSGMWAEGEAYKKNNIYDMSPGGPPVNYDAHIIKSHSITHMEAPAHTQKNGATVDSYFSEEKQNCFYGNCSLIKLKDKNWAPVSGLKDIFHWEVTLDELKKGIKDSTGQDEIPEKILLTVENPPLNQNGFHDPNYVLTLSQQAADYLVKNENFNAYGTSWKSSDFKPGSKDRPIHNTLFKKAAIFENLKLDHVPEGQYIWIAFPIPISKASESPVCPVLFTRDEIGRL